jgi:hypothetical protein
MGLTRRFALTGPQKKQKKGEINSPQQIFGPGLA